MTFSVVAKSQTKTDTIDLLAQPETNIDSDDVTYVIGDVTDDAAVTLKSKLRTRAWSQHYSAVTSGNYILARMRHFVDVQAQTDSVLRQRRVFVRFHVQRHTQSRRC